MIQSDFISKGLGLLCVMLSIYFSTIELSFLSVFPSIMIIASLTFQTRFGYTSEDTYVSEEEGKSMFTYLVMGIAGAMFTAQATGEFMSGALLSFAQTQIMLFAVMAAIAEEEFFRGLLMNFFMEGDRPPALAILLSSIVFATFHFAVYGTSTSALVYVGIAGMILGIVAYQTKKVSTSMMAHIAVNILAVGFYSVVP